MQQRFNYRVAQLVADSDSGFVYLRATYYDPEPGSSLLVIPFTPDSPLSSSRRGVATT
jgi:hypothetical protein